MGTVTEAQEKVSTWHDGGPFTVRISVGNGPRSLKTFTVFCRYQFDRAPEGEVVNIDEVHVYAGDDFEGEDDGWDELSDALKPRIMDMIWDEVSVELWRMRRGGRS